LWGREGTAGLRHRAQKLQSADTPLDVRLQSSHQPALNSPTKQKAEPPPTGLQALVEDGPPRLNGSDKFFGMENVVGVRPTSSI
jgi:hypothetical protein